MTVTNVWPAPSIDTRDAYMNGDGTAGDYDARKVTR